MTERLQGLDGLRAVAVMLVVLYHVDRVLFGGGHVVAEIGWVGVDVFFVLSGFLITGILRRSVGRPGWWRSFVVRRALRIFPLYYLVLAVLFAGRALNGVDTLGPAWIYPTFLSNFWTSRHGGGDLPLDVTWSLSVEEQFYLVWPLVVFATRRSDRAFGVVCAALVVAAPVLRFLVHEGPDGPGYMWTPCRMDAFAWGALAAWLRESSSLARSRVGAIGPWLAGATFVGLVALGDFRDDALPLAVGLSVVSSATAALVLAVADRRAGALGWALDLPPLVHVGQVSYGVYLLHPIVLTYAAAAAGTPLLWPLAAAVPLVTWAVATLTYRTIEDPFVQLKDRWT